MKKKASMEYRFWSKVKKGRDCWEWQAAKNRNGGYGRIIGDDGHYYSAHRVAWELMFGPIPEGQEVCHHCDNPICVRPDHLFLGSQTDNMRDMVTKGRIANGKAILTQEQVQAIRSVYKPGVITHAELARQYGVGRTTITQILSETRRHRTLTHRDCH